MAVTTLWRAALPKGRGTGFIKYQTEKNAQKWHMNHSQVCFSRARQKGVSLQNALNKGVTLARWGPAVWLLSWHGSSSETIQTEKSFIERNTKKYASPRENLSFLSRDSCVGLGIPPLHTQHFVSGTGRGCRRDHLTASWASCRCRTGSTQKRGQSAEWSSGLVSSQDLF